MLDSNYLTLKYCKLSRTETNKRLAYLENTIKQLETYHHKASKKKQPVIARLICAYDDLIEALHSKLGE